MSEILFYGPVPGEGRRVQTVDAAEGERNMLTPPEPTCEEVETNAVIKWDGDHAGRACWYPQMGGYVAKCVVEIYATDGGACFDAWVWHDGSFPFDRESRPGESPAHIHHCDAGQFVTFGNLVDRFQSESTEGSDHG